MALPSTTKRGKTERDPFEVNLDDEQQEDLVDFLCREIDFAEQARSAIVGDDEQIDTAHSRYEGGPKNLTKNTPWPGAANLGSFIVTEKVAAMRARIVATIFTDPLWVVEGWGASAEKAAFVESFHQWKAEASGLQQALGRAVHNSLIEGTGVLEVSDRVVLRKGVRKIRALIQRDEATGMGTVDNTGNPVLARLKNGKYVEADSDEPYVKMYVNDIVRATNGPSFRVLSLKNFFMLPGHASERSDLWGYAKRFYRRLEELRCRERDGYYKNIDDLGKLGEREGSGIAASDQPALDRQGQLIAPQYDKTAEKEIWEVTLLADLDDDGYEEWYVVTLSTYHRTLLRVQYQDYGTPHYILLVPFPRPNSVYGYSYGDDMLGTLYDEHAALRNMFVDRMNIATNVPFLKVEGSPWNPSQRPFGPGKVIPVRDLNEVKQLDVKDVPASIIQAMNMVLSAAERMSGMNDVTTGVQAQQDRTLGEVKLVTEQSWIRIDEAVKNCQEGLEDLFLVLNMIWKNKLEEDPEEMPGDLLLSMQQRGISLPDRQITADLLEGTFRGKPRGSVEASDFSKMRQDFAQLLTALTQMAQANPQFAMVLAQPGVTRSILSNLVRIYRWPDREQMLQGLTAVQSQPPTPPMLPGGPPGQPGAPGGQPGAPQAAPAPPQPPSGGNVVPFQR